MPAVFWHPGYCTSMYDNTDGALCRHESNVTTTTAPAFPEKGKSEDAATDMGHQEVSPSWGSPATPCREDPSIDTLLSIKWPG